jgi:hypothetical protein
MQSLDDFSHVLSEYVVADAAARSTWRGVLNVTRMAEHLARLLLGPPQSRTVWLEQRHGQYCVVRADSLSSLEDRGAATPSVLRREPVVLAVQAAVERWTRAQWRDESAAEQQRRLQEVRVALLEHDWITPQLLLNATAVKHNRQPNQLHMQAEEAHELPLQLMPN